MAGHNHEPDHPKLYVGVLSGLGQLGRLGRSLLKLVHLPVQISLVVQQHTSRKQQSALVAELCGDQKI